MGARGKTLGTWVAALLGAAACRGEAEDPVVRGGVREATITAEVRSRILAVDELRTLQLAVDTRGATVSVQGVVGDSSQARAVGAIARAVRGVEDARLDLRIVPDDSLAAPAVGPRPRKASPAGGPSGPAQPPPSLEEAG